MTARTIRHLAAVTVLVAGLAVYWDGARHAERRAWLVDQVNGTLHDPAQEALLAEAYWTRYPDVAAHALFGRNSRLGTGGAREHYNLHGRKEGRVWG